MMSRYQRQTLLPQIGPQGQQRLGSARVLLVGCGALGSVIADQLVRAGIGWIRLVDRDIVELTNLQRQVLFDESDAEQGLPKAIAAARRLGRVNSSVTVEPQVLDVHAGSIERLAGVDGGDGARVDLILDGTDNVETRYLVNDVSVKHGIPWVYGACVGTEGRVMAIRPGATPCLRCVFPEPPGVGELPTCDTAGVLGPAAAIVASLQSTAAIKLLCTPEDAPASSAKMISLDAWKGRFHSTSLNDARRVDCPTCALRQFVFLNQVGTGTTTLCGRNAVQVRPPRQLASVDTADLVQRLERVASVQRSPYFIKAALADESLELTVFPDGRAIIHGTGDERRARSIYARFVGL